MTISISLLLLFGGTITCLLQPTENQLTNTDRCDLNLVDEILRQVNSYALNLVDKNLRPVANQDQIKFYAWNQLGVNQVELKSDETQLREIFGTPQTTFLHFYFHDIGGNGLETWIQENKNHFLSPNVLDKQYAISVDYQTSVSSKSQAIINLEPIANRTAELLIKIKDLFPDRTIFPQIIGHGFGALIAASVAERVKQRNSFYRSNSFTALDPEIIDDEDPNLLEALKICKQIKIPQIHKNLGGRVYAVHTSTCSYTPVIPACDGNTTDTMGGGDFYPNGGGTQPGCLQTDSSCSRKRAPEIFVESNAARIHGRTQFYASQCSNFNEFKIGICNLCQPGPCYEMNIYFNDPVYGRFYFYTNSVPPYSRGYNQTLP